MTPGYHQHDALRRDLRTVWGHSHRSHIATTTTHTSPQPPLHTPPQPPLHTQAGAPAYLVRSDAVPEGRLRASVRVSASLSWWSASHASGAVRSRCHGCPVYCYPLPASRHAPAPPAPPAGHFGRQRQLGTSCDSARNRLRAVRAVPPARHHARDHALCASLAAPDASPSLLTGGPTWGVLGARRGLYLFN